MGKIFYSLAGEGRGHATRARTIIENLKAEHNITVFAPKDAFELLATEYTHSEITVKKIPGLCFHYSHKKLNYLKTGICSLQYLYNLPVLVKQLQAEIEREKPDLIITDFEPSLPRAAQNLGLPFLSIDHQHFLTTYNLRSLPLSLQYRAAFMAPTVNFYYRGQSETIVSSFYFPPLRKHCSGITQIGVLLGNEIVTAQQSYREHIVVYLRKFITPELHTALKKCGCPIHVYGLGEKAHEGNIRFHDINIQRFLADLSSCRALICTGGNQVVGEALYLKKPVLAMPEAGNFEQEINAHFLSHSGCGQAMSIDKITGKHIRNFLDKSASYISHIDAEKINGNNKLFTTIKKYLPSKESLYRQSIPEYDIERAVS